MNIGIFDSGLGGLVIAKSIKKLLPEYNYVYLGDTKRVPYGNRSHQTVYEFTCEALRYLFEKENCKIVIIACNTASARALRKVQQEFLPQFFPDRKVLGVLIPTAEEVVNYKKVGILATRGTVGSQTFLNEIHKLNPLVEVFENPAPLLVPIIEEGETKLAKPFLEKYLKPLLMKKIDALILGCTHYPILKKEILALCSLGVRGKKSNKNIKIISQDEIIPKKLKNYLARHPEIKLEKKSKVKILFTDITPTVEELSRKWFGKDTKINLVKIDN